MMKKKLTRHNHLHQVLLQLHFNHKAPLQAHIMEVEHELSEFGHEQSAISYTTPLLAPEQRERAWNATTTFYPDASATDLEAFYDQKTKRLMVKMAGAGKIAYLLLTKEGKQGHLRENPKLTVEKKILSANLQKIK